MPANALAGAQLGAGVVGAAGSFLAASDARAAGRRANEQAMMNAELLEELGVLKAEEVRRTRGRVTGTRIVAFAKGGLDPNTGSALDVMLDAATEDELAALNAKFGFESQAFQERVRGANAQFAAQVQSGQLISQGATSIFSAAMQAQGTFALLDNEADFDASVLPSSTQLLPATGGPAGSGNLLDLTPGRGGSRLTRRIA